MKYRTIRRKTYNNVMYLAKIISKEKGYPIRQAADIALRQFYDFDDSFQWLTVDLLMNNLVSYEEYQARRDMDRINMEGIY